MIDYNKAGYHIPTVEHPDKQTIVYWENWLSPEDIETLQSYLDHTEKKDAKIVVSSHSQIVSDSVRHTEVVWYEHTEAHRDIWQKITHTVAEVNERFFNMALTQCEPAQLALYTAAKDPDGVNSHYDWHWDMLTPAPGVPRKLSMCLMLSDPAEFEGGDLEVMAGSAVPLKLQQQQGRAWFFPSYLLHRVTPVTQGTRRSMVVWAGGPGFR